MERIFEDEDFDDAYQKILDMANGIILMREKERLAEIFEIQNSLLITVNFLKKEIYVESIEDNPQNYVILKKQLTKAKKLMPDLNLKFIDIFT